MCWLVCVLCVCALLGVSSGTFVVGGGAALRKGRLWLWLCSRCRGWLSLCMVASARLMGERWTLERVLIGWWESGAS